MGRQTWVQVYLWSARLFLASVVVQVFLIGLYLFANGNLDWHRGFALVPTVLSLVPLVAAFGARLATRSKQWSAALFVATFIQGALPSLKGSVPIVAALHPVNALLMVWLGIVVLRDAQQQAAAADELPVTSG
jgi:Family of unknown function (DUF6220)